MKGAQLGLELSKPEPPSERMQQGRAERDRILKRLEDTRFEKKLNKDIWALAEKLAPQVQAQYGAVTSPRLIAAMKAAGYAEHLKGIDKRLMGAFLRPSRGWRCVGEVQEGSHGRPVKLWVKP